MSNPYRLPRTIRPSRYDITIAPDLGRRDFVGHVDIAVDVHENTATVICNAAELEIVRAWVVDESGTRIDAQAIELDAEAERVTITLGRTLTVGQATVHYEFLGSLNDKLAGFYSSTYTTPDGTTKTIAATQFEATDARKAFPCWDEPDAKAVFGVTLVVAPGLLAISNSPQVGETVLSSGKRSIRFADTMIMSTYLVCFVVGELEATAPIDVNGVPLRVIHRPGLENLSAFALDIGAFALSWFASYYDIAYPGDKLDLIALPDFASGAMENLGAVTFRESLLMIDESAASRVELERVADVVAHEIAHMWFGDLVTMSWWNGLWLNEAFATFMEIACVAAFRPEWDRWTSFGVYRSAAMAVDALHTTRPIEYPVVSPTDAEGMFDVLTYEKGASVLRMLEQYLGEDRFRDGVRHYLRTHSYKNTETTDLWDAIEHIAGEPVRHMMDGWIFQGGFPLVSAAHSTSPDTPGGVELRQERFTYLPAPTSLDTATPSDQVARSWQVPVIVRLGVAADSPTQRVALGTEPVVISAAGSQDDRDNGADNRADNGDDDGSSVAVVNAGGHGFYRVRYDRVLLAKLRPEFANLSSIERYGLLADAWSAVQSGATAATAWCDLVESVAATESDANVWMAILSGLGGLHQIAPADAIDGYAAWVRSLITPVATRLGWEAAPGETALTGQLRGSLLTALGTLGNDPDTIGKGAATADTLTASVMARSSAGDSTSTGPDLHPDVAAAAITLGAISGGRDRWERYRATRSQSGLSPQESLRYLYGLGAFREPDLIADTLAMQLTDTVKAQDAPYALIKMLMSRTAGPTTWEFLAANWDALVKRIPSNTVARMVEGIVQRSEPDTVASIETFFGPGGHQVPQGAKMIEQSLERMRVMAELRAREGDAIGDRFRAHP
jgi:puromycin-sensitive aminopeptidase